MWNPHHLVPQENPVLTLEISKEAKIELSSRNSHNVTTLNMTNVYVAIPHWFVFQGADVYGTGMQK